MSCDWEYTAEDVFETSCDNAFQFIDGGPCDNEFRYCPYCGQEINEVAGIKDVDP